MAAPGKQPKTMSSRLAGMKFMQRGSSTPSTPTTPAEPPAKKQRLSNGSSLNSPATPLEPDEDKAETKWYLSFKAPQPAVTQSPLRIISAGYSTLDAADRDDESSDDEMKDGEKPSRPAMPGRKSFGKFNKKLEKQQNPDPSSSSDSSDAEDDEEEDGEIADDPTGVNALIAQGRKDASDRARAERKAKKKADAAEAVRLAEQRRKKEVNLNKVTSISGGGLSGGRPSGGNFAKDKECYNCGQKGHIKADCPQGRKRDRLIRGLDL